MSLKKNYLSIKLLRIINSKNKMKRGYDDNDSISKEVQDNVKQKTKHSASKSIGFYMCIQHILHCPV